MITVKEKDGFRICFDPNTQSYSVFKDGRMIVSGKHSYRQVKSYAE